MIYRLKDRKFGKSILLVIKTLKNTLYDGDPKLLHAYPVDAQASREM